MIAEPLSLLCLTTPSVFSESVFRIFYEYRDGRVPPRLKTIARALYSSLRAIDGYRAEVYDSARGRHVAP